MNFRTDVGFRKATLVKLLDIVSSREAEIIQALHDDFKKPAFESVLSETHFVQSDLKKTISNIGKWSKPRKVFPSLLNFPSTDYIYPEPYGSVLILAPWNYPFQLAMCPLIAAVAAGNSVTVKPSELTPHTSAMIAEIVRLVFDPNHVEVYQGGPEVAQKLLTHRWDYIFFTGSVAVGKAVAKAAAENLTPVTLELGGKNPCIVDESANIDLAARRIVWGKFLNAGQTCIAPDYILVQNKAKAAFIAAVSREITAAYGENPQLSPDFARIINTKNWSRLVDMIRADKIAFGGQTDPQDLYIAPTVIDEPSADDKIMQEEIFGPLLPVISYENPHEIETIIMRYEKPLSLYVFSDRRAFAEKIIRDFSFGGGCINDTVIQFGNARLPFGGVGHSGLGAYHGRYSFETFSHLKPVVEKANWLDIPLRYAPYTDKLKTLRTILKWF